MSPARSFGRHTRQQLDSAISGAYGRLARGSPERAAFTELLARVRQRSPAILRAPVVDGVHPGVLALFNLARFASHHVRPIAGWNGSTASWRGAVPSLAQHLLGRYASPRFLAAAWYAPPDDAWGDAKRHWFVAHAAGIRFRSLDLPMRMTRKMEDIFLASADHFGIEWAMRRAELLALGAPAWLAAAVLATPVAADLSDGGFWREAWMFLITHASAFDAGQVGPIIDFLHGISQEPALVQEPEGATRPAFRRFSLRGRTPRSLLRLVEAWHRGLDAGFHGAAWVPSHLRPMVVDIPKVDPAAPQMFWELKELLSGHQLAAEGAALQHCVVTYSQRCRVGLSRIWSLRMCRGENVRSVLTIEIDPRRRAVVQARGFRNRPASGTALRMLKDWASREHLRLAI